MNAQQGLSAGSPSAIVYTVQQFLWPVWHDVLTKSDWAKAIELKDKLGDKARVVETRRA